MYGKFFKFEFFRWYDLYICLIVFLCIRIYNVFNIYMCVIKKIVKFKVNNDVYLICCNILI